VTLDEIGLMRAHARAVLARLRGCDAAGLSKAESYHALQRRQSRPRPL
jgi:hypothetical protein